VFVIGKLSRSSLTNTLAYYENPLFTDKKCFITLDPGSKVLKLFTAAIYECLNVCNKFKCLSLALAGLSSLV
jgi:hypothetical protein